MTTLEMGSLAQTLFFALLFLSSPRAFGCSEAGPKDFKISKELTSKLGSEALNYAMVVAKESVTIDQSHAPSGIHSDVPSMPLERQDAKVYRTIKNKIGSERIVGFSVGLKSANGWECLYCVEFREGSSNRFVFQSITHHHCAK